MVTVVRIKNSKNWCMENKLNVYETGKKEEDHHVDG